MSAHTTRRRFLQAAANTAIALFALSGCTTQRVAEEHSGRNSSATPANGPLRVHPKNPRYFTDGSAKAIYLTGSHTWDNLCDYAPLHAGRPAFDYPAYLDFLRRYNHNFIRLWPGDRLDKRPSLYAHTDPGLAKDGPPRLDLTRLNQAYFDRLRERVVAARDRGVYVGVLLFLPDAAKREDWPVHLFNPANNVQGLNGDANRDGFGAEAYDLSNERITKIQEAYVRKVVDTVNDLGNVLYEIGNEGDLSSVKWQYHFIRLLKEYEATKPKQHPVGMSAVMDIVGGNGATLNEALLKSPADWISPSGMEETYSDDPPASDGSKVILADVDHIWPHAPQRAWVWKCFVRGIHPIHMDSYYEDGSNGISKDEQEAMRQGMGQTLRLAERLDLAAMTPHNDLASTKYCLAKPGAEYVVYLPGGEAVVNLSAAEGALQVEWIEPIGGTVKKTPPVRGGAKRTFRAPFDGHAVLYLRTE